MSQTQRMIQQQRYLNIFQLSLLFHQDKQEIFEYEFKQKN